MVIKMTATPSEKMLEPDLEMDLRPADILLVHTKRNQWAKLIRWATHCYWNHALLVYSVRDPGLGQRGMVVDAKTNGCIAIERADYYLARPEKFDLAVKRFDGEWFQSETANRICRLAAAEVDLRPANKLSRTMSQLLRQATLVMRFLRRKVFGPKPPPNLPWDLRLADFKAFTCAGFVQWCYYRAVSQIAHEEASEGGKLRQVVFNPKLKGEVTPFGLLTTTPADLAACQKLTWKYTVINGRLTNHFKPAAVEGI